MIYLTFFFTITLLIYGLLATKAEKKEQVKRRMDFFLNQKKTNEQKKNEERLPFRERVLIPIWKSLRKSLKRKLPGEKESKIEQLLLQAGNPFNMTTFEYRITQIGAFILFGSLSFLYGLLLNFSVGTMTVICIFSSLFGLYVPNLYLKLKVKERNNQALRELPDVLDLLTVSLEAGLGFDSALSKVIAKKDGVLSSEFHRCLEEVRLGKTRREALSGIRERLVLDEIHTFISSILQAEKLGIGMVQVLRVQSQDVREQRKQRAEEAAMKAPIKMLFPLVLFIFPSLFIVLLGPAILQFLQTFQQ